MSLTGICDHGIDWVNRLETCLDSPIGFRGLKPAEITLLEFIIQANDRGISEPPFNVSGYSVVTTHVSTGYCNTLWFMMHKSLHAGQLVCVECIHRNLNSLQTLQPTPMHM